MKSEDLATLEISRWDWPSSRDACGNPAHLPESLHALLDADSAEAAERAYWQLENHVVVQGAVFAAALPAVHVALAALAAPLRPRWVRISLLDLLFQILDGSPADDEAAPNSTLMEDCRTAARAGLWVLYREFCEGEREAAGDVLEIIETQPDRLAGVLKQ